MEGDDTFSFGQAPQSSILRHRKRKADRVVRKGLKPHSPRGGKRAIIVVLLSRYLPPLLNFIGIRPLRPNTPFKKNQLRELSVNILIATLLLVITLATRFYRLSFPAKIGTFMSCAHGYLSF